MPEARPDSRRRLADTARVRTVRSGDAVYRQGHELPLTLVLAGFGAFRRTTMDGRQLTLGIARNGDLFGFSSITSRRTPTDLIALTDVQVAQWSGIDVRPVVKSDQGLALDVIDRMASFLIMLSERLEGFLYQDARRRVVRVLAQYQDLFFDETPVLSRGDLASLVGTSRQMTGRVLRGLEREGMIVRTGRAGMRLLSPERLDVAASSLREPSS